MTPQARFADADDTVRPQDDLFGHVNGPWLESTKIPDDLSATGGFIDLRLDAEKKVGEILRDASAAVANGEAAEGSGLRKIGDLFASFMDEDRVEALGAGPLADDLAAIEAIDDLEAFARLLGRLQKSRPTPVRRLAVYDRSMKAIEGPLRPARRIF